MLNDIGVNNENAGKHEIDLIYDNINLPDGVSSSLDNMRKRLSYVGGDYQQNRMIQDKRRTLDKAVLFSYQGANLRKITKQSIKGNTFSASFRALINPNKLKQNYDDKIVSAGNEFDLHPGDIFEWENTNTYWIIYLEDLTELAYFRGEIRKCSYRIKWKDVDTGKVNISYVAVRGPVETRIDYIQKSGISVDRPNYSLDILIPKTESALKYFRRYSKFYLQDIEEGDAKTCWRIEATDSISMPGVLQLVAVEYYANEAEDNIDDGVVGELIPEPVDPNPETTEIIGETFIKPKKVYTYEAPVGQSGSWSVEKGIPVVLEINENKVNLKWTSPYHGQFDLHYGELVKTIVAESLF